MAIQNLAPEVVLALSKAVSSKDLERARAAFPEGFEGYVPSTIIEISGDLKVGAPYEKTIPNKIPWATLFAIALSKVNGSTVESIVAEALESNYDETAIKADVKTHIDALKETTRGPAAGAITADLMVRPA